MVKKGNPNFTTDLLPVATMVEVVKLDRKGEFIGIKDMRYGEWKVMKRQSGFIYRAFQKGFSKFKKQ